MLRKDALFIKDSKMSFDFSRLCYYENCKNVAVTMCSRCGRQICIVHAKDLLKCICVDCAKKEREARKN